MHFDIFFSNQLIFSPLSVTGSHLSNAHKAEVVQHPSLLVFKKEPMSFVFT